MARPGRVALQTAGQTIRLPLGRAALFPVSRHTERKTRRGGTRPSRHTPATLRCPVIGTEMTKYKFYKLSNTKAESNSAQLSTVCCNGRTVGAAHQTWLKSVDGWDADWGVSSS